MKPSRTANLADVDIKLLRVFQAVVERGGFSAAEIEVNIGRSAISRYMADLETRLGLRLCERGRSGFSVTEHGQAVYEETLQLFANIERFNEKVGALRGRLSGRLSLGTVDDTATDSNNCIARLIARVKERGPELTIYLELGPPNDIERMVIQGQIHAGVVPMHRQLPGLNYHPLYKEELRLYCAPGHVLFDLPEDELKKAAVTSCEFVAPNYFHHPMSGPALKDFAKTAETNQIEGVAILVFSGKFLGFLPRHYVEHWVRQGGLREILCQQYAYEVPFALIVQKTQRPNVLSSLIVEELDALTL